jgi:transcriptional regulator with XRE-family HTH domain
MQVHIQRAPFTVKIDENSPLGLHIKQHRHKLRISQRKVSLLLGVDDEAVMCWETGINQPQIQYVPKIIEFLGYNPYAHLETKTFGGKIKFFRLTNGLSYRNLAKVLGSDMGRVAMWEKNKRTPKEPRLSQLLEILNSPFKTEYTKTSSEAELGTAEAQPNRNSLV